MEKIDKRKYNKGTEGNKGGRKPKIFETNLRALLDENIDAEAILRTLNVMALKGNLEAIKLYLSYRYGNPTVKYDIEQTKTEIPTIVFKKLDE